jgi:subtilisin family serine protease
MGYSDWSYAEAVRNGVPIIPAQLQRGQPTSWFMRGDIEISTKHLNAALKILAKKGIKARKVRDLPSGYTLVRIDGADLQTVADDLRRDLNDDTAADVNLVIGAAAVPWLGPAGPPRPAPAVTPSKLAAGEGVTVAILDTGIVAGASLPDWLAESLQPVGADDAESPDAGPAAGHGLFLAGLVALAAPRCRIVARRVMDSFGLTDGATVVTALEELLGENVDLFLLGGGGYTRDDRIPRSLEAMVSEVAATGALFVAPAGNSGSERPSWPAALEDAVGVGSLDQARNASSFSNRGGWVDAWERGENLTSTYIIGHQVGPAERPVHFQGYATWSGTSMAAALVTGRVAAAMSREGIAARPALLQNYGGPTPV